MLHSLRLQHFRCYAALNWRIPAQGAILCGNNAQGKTSILEAICFALTLHSPRSSRLERLSQHGTGNFGISLSHGTHTRRIRWKPRHLELQVDKHARRDYSDYLQDAPSLCWLGNKDIQIVQGGSEERRRYLDFLGTQWHPAYRQALLHYKKALKARNALLKNPRCNPAALSSFTQLLVQHGRELIHLRGRLLQRLAPYVEQSHHAISGAQESIELQYQPSATGDLIAAAMEDSLATDMRLGHSQVGPHRDDIILLIQGQSAVNFASEGQQRSLATAMQLAQANLLRDETAHAPILLIDDIFGELDLKRRRALLKAIPADSQVLITTTQSEWLEEDENWAASYPIFHVEGAKIVEESQH